MEIDVNEAERADYRNRVRQALNEPSVVLRLTRRLAATELLVCGRPGGEASATEPIFVAGMRLGRKERNLLAVSTARDGRDCVHLGFDVDDLEAEPAISVLRPRGGVVIVDHGCELWIASDAKRAVIVPIGDGTVGSHAFRRGSQLVQLTNRPPQDLLAGMLRAETLVWRLAASSDTAIDSLENANRCATTKLALGAMNDSGARAAA